MKKISLDTIADGVAKELFLNEILKVSENILDPNTSALASRSITLTFTFKPDDKREEVKVIVEAKAKIASVKPYAKTSYMGKNNGKAQMFVQDTKQLDMVDDGVTQMKPKAVVG